MITIHHRRGYKVVEVDTKKAEFKGLKWRELGGFGKKKFDNYLFLTNLKNKGTERTKIIYV